MPTPHGLELGFYVSGRLATQRFYDRGLLRWVIAYHPTGGRAQVGFYAATQPLSYPEHGLHTRYAPNGTVISECFYEQGRRHGWWKQWEDDGYPIGATRFEHGKAVESNAPDGRRGPP